MAESESNMFAVFGASGNIGGKLSNMLIDAGQQLKVVGRSEKGLREFTDKGIQTLVGDPENEDFLIGAFSDVEAAFLMTPPDYSAESLRGHYNRLGQKIAQAVQTAGVKHIVNLSCMGAHMSEKVGPIKGLYDQELRLNTLKGINIIHLRPAYLMDNLLGDEITKNINGKISSLVRNDIKMPMISAKDVANFAYNFLLEKNFSEKSYIELFGSENISLNDAVKIIGEKTNNQNLSYERLPYGKVFEDLLAQGMSEDAAHCTIEFARAINDGLLFSGHEGRTEDNTGEISFKKWAETFYLGHENIR
jgi:uncharacterized protein YbjT (DUF2867 family)